MNRFKFSRESIKNTIQYLKDDKKEGPVWAKRFKNDFVVKRNKLFFQNKEVIAFEDVDRVLRREMYKIDGDVNTGRDAAFHTLKKRYIGIGRRKVMDFIRRQKPLGEVKAALNQPKQKSGKRLRVYTFETDLIFLKKNDLEQANKKFIHDEIPELSYILTTVEKITGLSRFDYVLRNIKMWFRR